MQHSLKVGQSIVIKTLNKNYRNGFVEKIFDVKISKLGRKYFYIESEIISLDGTKFSFDTMYNFDTNYSPTYKAYLDRQTIKDELLKNSLSKDISKYFNNTNGKNDYTLEQIKSVCSILNIKQDEK